MAHCCLGWKFIINLFSPKCLLNMVKRKKEKKNGQVRGSSFFTVTVVIFYRDGNSSGGTSRWIFPPEKNPFVGGEGESSLSHENDPTAAQLNNTNTSEVSFLHLLCCVILLYLYS